MIVAVVVMVVIIVVVVVGFVVVVVSILAIVITEAEVILFAPINKFYFISKDVTHTKHTLILCLEKVITYHIFIDVMALLVNIDAAISKVNMKNHSQDITKTSFNDN